MNKIFICKCCGDECAIDGDYPKFFCWCDFCNDYAEGFDCNEYAADIFANDIDYNYERFEEGY